ncbi:MULTISPECIES: MlaD family protein [unclassified Pseudonocardia]|uniref:MlaD family protein n=1 Tax=unclassified Pseudonocardia TaxID=2619320 RepID=UPI0001FFE4B8|nr:MlaD family protein [Pseudonocardia sp. Ae707_Ps1]OLM16734.1 hypothetical protein Ae707Ps1_0992 [Pseudonocardia sp. Ae707_Ps1]
MAKRVHRTDIRNFLVGVVALAVLVTVAVIGGRANTGGSIPFQTYTFVRAAFDNVGNLDPTKQDVRYRSVPIGEVVDSRYDNGTAVVTLRLKGEWDVHSDATARVLSESALGRKFIDLDLGSPSAGPLGDQVIAADATEDSLALDDVLNVFDQPTRDGLRSSMVELGGGAFGHGPDLQDAVQAAPALLGDLRAVGGALTAPDADLPGLLDGANTLAGRFAGRQQELENLVRQADVTMQAVSVDGGRPLGDTMKVLPGTLRDAKQALEDLETPLADTRAAVEALPEGADALGRATPDLRGVLTEAPRPLGKVPDVADRAGPAVEDLTGTLADARPLVPQLQTTLGDANVLVSGLSPFSNDIGRFFEQLTDPDGLLSGSYAPGKHYFQIMVAAPPGPGLVSLPDDAYRTDPYPSPDGGASEDENDDTPIGGGR